MDSGKCDCVIAEETKMLIWYLKTIRSRVKHLEDEHGAAIDRMYSRCFTDLYAILKDVQDRYPKQDPVPQASQV